jgi:HEAT repeat protein
MPARQEINSVRPAYSAGGIISQDRRRAVYFLVAVALILPGCKYFERLESRLLSDDDARRAAALKRVAELSDSRREKLVPPMIDALKNPDSRIATRAVKALAAVGEPAIQPLIQLAADRDAFVRACAASALGQMGPSARAAVPMLANGVKDSHPVVRIASIEALTAIGDTSPPVADSFKIAEADPDSEVRAVANEASAKLFPPPPAPVKKSRAKS